MTEKKSPSELFENTAALLFGGLFLIGGGAFAIWALGAIVLLLAWVLNEMLIPIGMTDYRLKYADEYVAPFVTGVCTLVIAAIIAGFVVVRRRAAGTPAIESEEPARPPETPPRSGVVKYILFVCDVDASDINLQSLLANLLPRLQVSYKRDVTDDCQIQAIEDNPQRWHRARLQQQASSEWNALEHNPDLIVEYYKLESTGFGPAWILLIREPQRETEETGFNYPGGLFPWNTQLSFTIWESERTPFNDKAVAELQALIDSSELTYTSGYEPDIHHAAEEASFGPHQVQFYDAAELHMFWDRIKRWTAENNAELLFSSPVGCPSCGHYTPHKYHPCIVCNNDV